MRINSVLFGVSVLIMTQGCFGKGPNRAEAQSAAESKIRNQAAFDLQCDANKLDLKQIDSSENYTAAFFTYGVQGCEKRVTFKASCTGATDCYVGTESQVSK